jgi:hypothetical protein
MDELFVGVFPCGLSFCDKTRDENGDYLKVAFLPYATLKLEWYGKCPADMRLRIEATASEMIDKRGQEFRVTTSGQTVMLGESL